jgi:hypothetical protein
VYYSLIHCFQKAAAFKNGSDGGGGWLPPLVILRGHEQSSAISTKSVGDVRKKSGHPSRLHRAFRSNIQHRFFPLLHGALTRREMGKEKRREIACSVRSPAAGWQDGLSLFGRFVSGYIIESSYVSSFTFRSSVVWLAGHFFDKFSRKNVIKTYFPSPFSYISVGRALFPISSRKYAYLKIIFCSRYLQIDAKKQADNLLWGVSDSMRQMFSVHEKKLFASPKFLMILMGAPERRKTPTTTDGWIFRPVKPLFCL